MQDNMKQNNNHIIGIPDGEEDHFKKLKMAKFQDKERIDLKGSKGETGSNIQGSPKG